MILQVRREIFEDRLLDGFAFRGGLDHKIYATDIGQRQCRLDSSECFRPVFVSDLFPGYLPLQIAVDQRDSGRQSISAHVIQEHIIPRQSHDVSNAIAHLPSPYDPDRLYFHLVTFAKLQRQCDAVSAWLQALLIGKKGLCVTVLSGEKFWWVS